jgi:hypothetical protein
LRGRVGQSGLSRGFASSATHDPHHRPHQHEHGHQYEHRYQIARNTNPTLVMSSMVDSTGAAIPAVATLAAGRTVDFVSDTTSAVTTPIATGIH